MNVSNELTKFQLIPPITRKDSDTNSAAESEVETKPSLLSSHPAGSHGTRRVNNDSALRYELIICHTVVNLWLRN